MNLKHGSLEPYSPNIAVRNGEACLYQTAQFLWIGGVLSKMEVLSLISFLQSGFICNLYTYKEVPNVPPGINVLDAREIIPEREIFLSSSPSGKSYAQFADIFRYKLLSDRGGWWFDLDVVAIKNIKKWNLDDREILFASTWEGGYGECASNCVIYSSTPANPIIQDLYSSAIRILEENSALDFCSIGPFLVQSIIRKHQLKHSIAPFYVFCPYPWRLIGMTLYRAPTSGILNLLRRLKHVFNSILSNNFKQGYIRKTSLTIHFHNEIIKSIGYDKNGKFAYFCLFEKLKRRFQIP